MKQRKITLWHMIWILYCAMMLWLLFHRTGYEEAIPYAQQLKYNLIPFETITRFWRLLDSSDAVLRRHAVINLAGNVIMFIPLGFFLPKLWPWQRAFPRTMLTTAGIITAVEIAQLLTLVGSCDTDDLILNLFGSGLGYGIYKLHIKMGLSN